MKAGNSQTLLHQAVCSLPKQGTAEYIHLSSLTPRSRVSLTARSSRVKTVLTPRVSMVKLKDQLKRPTETKDQLRKTSLTKPRSGVSFH